MKTGGWLLLLYVLPTRRNAERVHLWRKLKKFGAVQLKTSAYVLPDAPTHYERFQWLSTQISDAGGDATLIRVAAIEGMGNEDIVEMFNKARKENYGEFIKACLASMEWIRNGKSGELNAELARQHRRFLEIREVDYFSCPAAGQAERALRRLERLVNPREPKPRSERLSAQDFARKLWLTRGRPGIDRAGSAWLVRKFIDRKARFVFADDPSAHPEAIPFDMADVEFSHHGDDCTFETLVKRFGIKDKAVAVIAEMVHDADLEDGKFQRPECIGVNCVLGGLEKSGLSDAELLTKGMECFEALYRQLSK